ncbi:hypothetical protein V8E36_005790 [Tilletia maclaganii]
MPLAVPQQGQRCWANGGMPAGWSRGGPRRGPPRWRTGRARWCREWMNRVETRSAQGVLVSAAIPYVAALDRGTCLSMGAAALCLVQTPARTSGAAMPVCLSAVLAARDVVQWLASKVGVCASNRTRCTRAATSAVHQPRIANMPTLTSAVCDRAWVWMSSSSRGMPAWEGVSLRLHRVPVQSTACMPVVVECWLEPKLMVVRSSLECRQATADSSWRAVCAPGARHVKLTIAESALGVAAKATVSSCLARRWLCRARSSSRSVSAPRIPGLHAALASLILLAAVLVRCSRRGLWEWCQVVGT